MTLQHFKNEIEKICLSNRNIQSFDYGEDYQLATGKGKKYPLAFLELPYNIDYSFDQDNLKTVQFALLILFTTKGKGDDVKGDHMLISQAESIGDNVTQIIYKTVKGFKIDSVNGLSLREFSDDNATGVRLEIKGQMKRDCNLGDFTLEC
ncbi:hypothetical protein WSM22_03420 [Cytophagales bacterium WSM2-2]|nr:hypothetical protein WSM22_03420 [Cytophagales bacterium WSM2-2]